MIGRVVERIVAFPTAVLCLCLLIAPGAGAAEEDGAWRLKISGSNLFFYGTRMLTAGVRQDWEVDIEFSIKNGGFEVGSGTGRLLGEPKPYSKPEHMFQCTAIDGSYLDRGLNIVSTPRMRYQGFPLAGEVAGGQVVLRPGVEYIGNFIAMIYECSTADPLAEVWLERGRRSAIERAKRLGATPRIEGGRTIVRVKEVQPIAPRGVIELPLVDGYRFYLQDQAALSEWMYVLTKE